MKSLPSLLLTTVFLSNLAQEPPSISIKDKKQKKQKLPILIDEFRWNTNSYTNDFF